MQVLKITLDGYGRTCLEVKTIDPKRFLKEHPDTYPSDIIPRSVIDEAMSILAKRLGFTYSSACPYRYYYRWRLLDWEPLKAYSPPLHRQFVLFLADTIEKHLYSALSNARCVYVDVKGTTLYIYVG